MILPRTDLQRMLTTMRLASALAAPALLCALVATPALANDSEAEWALGGLVLKTNAAISMDREELFISSEEVRVDYVYTNHSPEDREVLIAFPLPAQPDPEAFSDYYAYPDWNELDFTTTVNGETVDYEVADRAMLGERDVTELVAAEGLPLRWFLDYAFMEGLDALDEGEKARLVATGLFKGEQEGDRLYVQPAWQVQRSLVRRQVFPAKSTVNVSHRYTPLIGGSAGGLLDPEVRKEFPDLVQEYADKWCTDANFIAGVDRKLASPPKGKTIYYAETWIGYVLKSGSNWAGPIKDFRLVVDKGEPGNLVSFCMDGVTKISPTQFEVRKTDFEPERDLDILILGFYEIEE